MRYTIAIFSLMTGFMFGAAVFGHADNAAATQIRNLMLGTFDRPEQRLLVDPVVVVGDHAIAGWAQGDIGGRALLRRKSAAWQLVLCSGDQIKSAEALVKIGLSADDAKTLAARLAAAEAKLPPERLAMFSRFDGIVMMDAGGQHPPAHSTAPHSH